MGRYHGNEGAGAVHEGVRARGIPVRGKTSDQGAVFTVQRVLSSPPRLGIQKVNTTQKEKGNGVCYHYSQGSQWGTLIHVNGAEVFFMTRSTDWGPMRRLSEVIFSLSCSSPFYTLDFGFIIRMILIPCPLLLENCLGLCYLLRGDVKECDFGKVYLSSFVGSRLFW